MRIALLLLALLAAPAWAAPTFFWRLESSTTLDMTHDYSAGDQEATISGTATFDTTIFRVGAAAGEYLNANARHEFDSASIYTHTAGCWGFWFYADTTWDAGTEIMGVQEVAAQTNHQYVGLTGTDGAGGVRTNIRSVAAGQSNASTGDIGLGVDTWYFVKNCWNQSAGTVTVQVYDTNLSTIGSPGTATSLPSSIFASTPDRMFIGEFGGGGAEWYVDTVIFSDDDTEALEDYAEYTSYTQIGGSGGVTPVSTLQNLSKGFGPHKSQQLNGLLD